MAVLKLLLVRHGQSVGNTEGRMEGCSSTGLTPLGVEQSRRLGQHLATADWHPTHIYCSPLARSTATLAEIVSGMGKETFQAIDGPDLATHTAIAATPQASTLASSQPVPVTLLDALKEYDAGIFTGLTWAETLEQGHNRAQRVVNRLVEHHRNGDRVLVISHHWILQHVIACLMGCDRTWGLPMANTAMFEFWLDRDRWPQPGPNRLNSELWRIKRFNDTTHLQS